MQSEFNLLDATFMNIHRHSDNTIPQRCLVALIDVNRLKVNLSQLRQVVGKQLQKLQGILSLASQAYQQISSELIKKILSVEEKQTLHRMLHEAFQQKEDRVSFLTTKIEQMQMEKDKIMSLVKRQTQTMSKLKLEHEFEMERLNLRINQLYSIIHEKSAVIESLNAEDALNKEVIRSYTTYRKPRASCDQEQRCNSSHKKQNRSQSYSRLYPLNERRTSRDFLYPPSNKKQNHKISSSNQKNFPVDSKVMQKISDLITSITQTNIHSHDSFKSKENNAFTSRHHCQKSEETQKFQNRPVHKKSTTLDSLYKNAIKGYRKNNKLFK